MHILRPAWISQTKSAALVALWVALIAQAIWTANQLLVAHASLQSLTRPLVFTIAFLLVALTRGNNPWIATLGRFVIAGAFLLALWNRFDNFPGFVAYAGLVNSFMPRAWIPTLAVVATAGEVLCCIAMFFGVQTRLAAFGSALLLFMFATAMTISGLSQFDWAVYVLSTGAWTLATVDASRLSLDSILSSNERWESRAEVR